MRNGLLGTSALVCALLVAPLAHAELEVSMGGYVLGQAGFFDAGTSTERDFRSKSELRLTAKNVADNGLEYGARVDLLSSTNQTTNSRRTGVYASGSYGRLELGDLDGASSALSVLAPTVGIGQINGSYVNFIDVSLRPAGSVIDTGGGMIRPMDSDQATKVTYYTPRVAGLQGGISYAPEVDSMATGENVQTSDSAGNHADMLEAGINYRTRYDNGVSVHAGLTFDMADAKSGAAVEDVRAWGLGLRVGYKGFELGGGYVDNGDSSNTVGTADDDETSFNLGGRYTQGPWGVALSYINEDYSTNGGRGTDTSGGSYDAVVLGGTYKIAEGLSAGADLAFFERNKQTGTDDDGYVLVVETKASF